MIEVVCPNCETSLSVPDKYEGQEGRCKKCGGKVVAPLLACVPPDPEDEPPPAPPAQFIPDIPVTQLEVLPPSRTFEEEEARLTRVSRISGGVYCRGCGTVIHKSARACPQCGAPQQDREPHRQSGENKMTVKIERAESATFAIITLLFYLFGIPLPYLYLVGVALTLVGLLTGPQRGCFGVLFLLFIVLPIGLSILGVSYAHNLLAT